MNIADLCRRQSEWCDQLGSPLYAALLDRSADDYDQRGPVWHVLASQEENLPGLALPLQLMGAVHRLVLEGHAPELALFYPSVGGSPDPNGAWNAFTLLLNTKADALRNLLRSPVQTNDVGRSGTLLGGFLCIAKMFDKPLRLLELGASAGLNLCWDHYRYEWGNGNSWGDASSAVRLTNVFRNQPPRFPATVTIAERIGCDKQPIDASTPAGLLTLLSYTWADQNDRIARLISACATASKVAFSLDEASAGVWLEEQLSQPHAGTVTVIFHSVVWQYLSHEEQSHVKTLIDEAGHRATNEAPVAWLRMEPEKGAGAGKPEVRLKVYPGPGEVVLATSSYHSPAVLWLEQDSDESSPTTARSA